MKEMDIDQINEEWVTALRKKKWGLAASLWKQHATVLRVNARVEEHSVLFHFLLHGQLEWVNAMIQAGAHWSSANERGKTPLMLAAGQGYVYSVKRALAAGCPVNVADENGETALMHAVKAGSADIVRLLIKAGCDVHRQNKKGQHALFFLTPSSSKMEKVQSVKNKNNLSILQELVEAGVNMDHQDHQGQTVLMQSFRSEHLEYLLQKGASVNLKDHEGQTALMIKAAEGNADSVMKLIRHGAWVNDQDHEGRTALMHGLNPGWLHPYGSTKWCLKEMVQALLEGGSDLNRQDHEKKTALDYAKDNCSGFFTQKVDKDVLILLETYFDYQCLQRELQEKKDVKRIKRL